MFEVAALFIDPHGPYPTIPGVECWGLPLRNALNYIGPYPVVAHPPCQLWVNFAALNFKRYGGEHNRPGNDLGCFAFALAAVRMFGGVLEHPASSNAWKAHDLAPPTKTDNWTCDYSGGWTTEIWQSAYGHKARKRTWLYYSGTTSPSAMAWERLPGTHQCGWFDRNKPTLGKKEASRTPSAFAQRLVELARCSR